MLWVNDSKRNGVPTMKKLLRGILDFRQNMLPSKLETFAKLAVGQSPDVLFIACSDSRVAPNWFASTDPGDMFVVRNVGNLVPPFDQTDHPESDHSVSAAIEFAVWNLHVKDIIVCGHSGCGAIHALAGGLRKLPPSGLRNWLSFAEDPIRHQSEDFQAPEDLSQDDWLSQFNVLEQVKNLKSYPKIRQLLDKHQIRLHAWWFDIAHGSVFAYNEREHQYMLIDQKYGEQLLSELD
jgi:carbonic anhydrase